MAGSKEWEEWKERYREEVRFCSERNKTAHELGDLAAAIFWSKRESEAREAFERCLIEEDAASQIEQQLEDR